MGQGWPGVAGTDKIRLSRADIVERFETIRSLFGGETAPADPVPGQPWWKDSTGELSVWSETEDGWISLTTRPSALPGYVTPEAYGAKGDGSTDDKAAFGAALATGKRVLGDPSKTYAINGTMTICTTGNSAWIECCRFKQINPNDAARRTLYASGGVRVVLIDVFVDRNGDGGGGSWSAAGIWLSAVARAYLERVEVFGDDKGAGIQFSDCDNVECVSPYVHDIKGGTSAHATITDDVVAGINIFGAQRVMLLNPRIEALTSQWSGQTEWARFTRGICFGQGTDGARRITIVAPMVEGCDQGIDVTGGGNVRYGSIFGGYIKDCLTYGLKFANNPQFWTTHGLLVEGCGRANIVCSGNAALSPQTSKILFTACFSLAAGRVSNYWRVSPQSQDSVGALILNTATTDWPREILFRDCVFDGAGGTMKYGIDNQAVIGGAGDQWVEHEDCHVSGVASGGKKFRGVHQGYAERQRGAAQSIASGSWVDLDFDTSGLKDGMSTSGAGSQLIRLLRGGIYALSASIVWDYAAGGSRMARLVRKRSGEGSFSEVPGTYQRVPPLGAGQMAVPLSAIFEADDNTQVKLQVQQDTGGNVNAYGTLAVAAIQKGSTFS